VTVLSIDTAQEFGSLALAYGAELLEEVPLHAPDGFSSILFDQLQKLLRRNNIELKEIDIYAAAAGPGSFTGIRIGLSAAKSLAFANAKPCYGVSNLAAMANLGTEPARAAVIDARRGEVYGGVFGDHPVPETVAPFPTWLKTLPQKVTEFLAFDFAPFALTLDASPLAAAARTTCPRALAASVAELALERFRLGEDGDPAQVDANYVRRSDAELLWTDRTS
jgi:tRNA threonylcarbamoyladenosine biosynthesis protein TsaB